MVCSTDPLVFGAARDGVSCFVYLGEALRWSLGASSGASLRAPLERASDFTSTRRAPRDLGSVGNAL